MIEKWYVCKLNGRYFKAQSEYNSIDEVRIEHPMLHPVFGPCSVDEADQYIEDMAPPDDNDVTEDGRFKDGRDDLPPTIQFFLDDDDLNDFGDLSWKGE